MNRDIARCAGTSHAACQTCLRAQRYFTDELQYWIEAPIDMMTGHCREALYARTWTSNTTSDHAPPSNQQG